MTYLYHISRTLVAEKISKFGHLITGRALDVGCGTYSRYAHLLNASTVVKLDHAQNSNVDIVGSADNLPFGDGEFDSAFSTHVFEHLEFPEKAVKELYRVLKPGAHALITVPQFHEVHEAPHDYFRYTQYGMKSLFERHGFTTVAFEPLGGFFSNLTRMVQAYLKNRFSLLRSPLVRVFSFAFKMTGTVAVWLDQKDTSEFNRGYPMGWAFVFRK